MSGLGSPSDPCLSPLAWSVTGKYLASAMEKMVNIWQVNGNYFVFLALALDFLFCFLFFFTVPHVSDRLHLTHWSVKCVMWLGLH